MLVQKRARRLSAQLGVGAFSRTRLVQQPGVQAEKSAQVVRLSRRNTSDSPPESGDSLPCLAPEHTLGSEVDRGIGIKLKHEGLGEVCSTRRLSEAEQTVRSAIQSGETDTPPGKP